ncbi:beta-propeller domain-containing protein [Parvibacter caecicola]|uniref:beta-propeller domain-containing protein n=1 Tax=Parvibacter caecicola TaxID=747645 RepID=UPI00249C108A|nr:beta-propeller domain-containing protein [Parvibacter caecicola]
MTRQDEFDAAARALRADAEQHPVPASLQPEAIEAMLLAHDAQKADGETAGGRQPASVAPAPVATGSAAAGTASPRRHVTWRWPVAAAACLALLCGVGVVGALAAQGKFSPAAIDAPSSPLPAVSDPSAPASPESGFSTAQGYAQVRDCLLASQQAMGDGGTMFMEDKTAGVARTETATAFTAQNSTKDSSFTDTNERTEGIGEADVAKTDGRWLYALQDSGTTVAIVDPAEGHMTPAGAIEAPKGAQVSEFYVEDGRLYLLSTVFPEGVEQPDGTYTFPPETTRLDVYDVTDPANPQATGLLTQTGTYNTVRFADGYVYLFSDQWTYDTSEGTDPSAYVPCVNGAAVECGDIYLPPENMGDHYLVITTVDAANPSAVVDQKAILCNGGSVYMSQDSIFLYETTGYNWGIMPIARFAADDMAEPAGETDPIAEAVTEDPGDAPADESENGEEAPGATPPAEGPDGEGVNDDPAVDDPATLPADDPATLPADGPAAEPQSPETPDEEAPAPSDNSADDPSEGEADTPDSSGGDDPDLKTCIRKFTFDKGQLEGVAQGEVNGTLDSSFCLDEYNGYLRVVTTVYGKDTSSALTVLNEQMEEVGNIADIAPGEQVYSARFMGNVGYFVTFKQVDPLFSVDLSNPENPTIIGQLKIPGFSEYLHPYGENLLLGIGMSADDAGATDGVKLSMFDTSNPADVREVATAVLDGTYYSDVFNEYRAALIDPASDMIGFPVSTDREAYAVYGYSEDNGFSQHMLEETNGTGWVPTRGIRIGDVLYVVKGNAVESYRIGDYQKIDDLLI